MRVGGLGPITAVMRRNNVMRGLDPRIHAVGLAPSDVDGRVKPGHDGLEYFYKNSCRAGT
jgi:hypothetical protein